MKHNVKSVLVVFFKTPFLIGDLFNFNQFIMCSTVLSALEWNSTICLIK